jgi:penicillin-binding protein 1C
MTNPQPESSDDKTVRLSPAELESSSASTPPTESPAQHPTGDPELTAGWYRPEVEAGAKAKREVELDESGMPRVRRVTEQDPGATRVQRRATQLPPTVVSQRPPSQPPPGEPTLVHRAAAPRRNWRGCLWRMFVYGAFGVIGLTVVAIGAAISGYWYIARDLPPVDDLEARASQFETTRIYDAQGNLLYELVDPQAGRRTTVPLDQISPYLLAATIATEDKNFYSHPGFDPLGILRAIVQNVQEGETVSGASTITQQLVRALVLSSEERAQRTAMRKIREIILAAEVTRTYPRDKILELYLNEIYYGNLAYGVEAASETYFNKKAKDLTLAEAAFLAGLPQSPAVYDIYTNREATLERQRQALVLMVQLSAESPDCIPVSTGRDTQHICVAAEPDYRDALTQISDKTLYPFNPPKIDARFPHWVNYVRQILEEQYGAEIYRDGYSVYTTLDPSLQALAEQAVAEQVAGLADRHVTNGALVALRPTTGEILVMVGSDNYDDPTDGQINMALRPRQPGSSIKPLTYALAFEKGWTPATLLWDVPTEFPDGANPPYKPVNYDGRFHGGVTVRYALANSYNLPAVKALQFVGIRGVLQTDASGNAVADTGLIPFAEKLGVTTLTRQDYGLSLTLGGGEVPLMEMVTAYGALANNGQRVFPVAISRITTFAGDKIICQQPLTPADLKADPPPCQVPPADWGAQVMSAETAYLIGHILSDNAARSPAFGPNSTLRLSFDAAVKTGTTNDFIDNWTLGYTPNLVTGVWVGNADYTPMVNTSGVTGAAPIWHAFMEAALGGGKASPFGRPATIVERQICAISGAEPSEFCPPDRMRTEVFAPDKLPLPKERDLWQRAFIDSFTSLYQTAECAQYYQLEQQEGQQKIVVGVSDPFAQKWLTEDPNGQAWAASVGINPPIMWAPTAECKADSPHPIMEFVFPAEGAVLDGKPVQILGQAAAQPVEQFDHYLIEYGLSHDPQGWGLLLGPSANPILEIGKLADWDLTNLPDGPITLRIIVFSKSGGAAEERVRFTIQKPTPTAAPSETVIPTETPTPSVTPTLGGRATLTPTITDTPTLTLLPSETPTPTETLPSASDTPTPTIEPTATETATVAPP